jgi:hypothetical protein
VTHAIEPAASAAGATPGPGIGCRARHGAIAACARCGQFYCPECAGSGPLALCVPCLSVEGGAGIARLEGKPIGLAELGVDLVLAPGRAIERLRRGRATFPLWLGPAALPLLGVAHLARHGPLSSPGISSPLAPDRVLAAALVLGPLLGVAFSLLFAALAGALLRLLGGHVEARTARAVLLGALLPPALLLPLAAAIQLLLPDGAGLARTLLGTVAVGAVAWSFLFAVLTLAIAARTGGAGPTRPLGPVRAALGLGAALLATVAAIGTGAVLGGLLFR